MAEHSTSAGGEATKELTLTLVEAVTAVHRSWRRASAPRTKGRRTQPQISLARVVRRAPGVTVHDAAQQLNLAPNTVSTLVGQLVAAGWLERRTDDRDRRVARLHLTEEGSARMRAWRERRAEVVGEALDQARSRLGEQRVREAIEVLELVAEAISQATPSQEAG